MLTQEKRIVEDTPKTQKTARSKATKKAVAMRAKHVRPNKATKVKAVEARGCDTENDEVSLDEFPKMFEGEQVHVEPVSLNRLSAMMLTVEEIAEFYGISLSTMNRRLRKPELRQAYLSGRAHAKANIRIAQLKIALSGNTQMLIWLGKQCLGQKSTPIGGTSAEDELPPLEEERVITIPWTKDLEAEWAAIDADFPELDSA